MKEREIVRCGHMPSVEVIPIGDGDDTLLYLCQVCYDRLEAAVLAGVVYKVLSRSVKGWAKQFMGGKAAG